MALQSFGGRIFIPEHPAGVNGGPTLTNITIDADLEGIAAIFQAPVTGTITGFGLPTGTALTTADAAMDFRLESVDLSGTAAIPSGSLIAAGRQVDVNVNAASSWFNGVLGTSYNAIKGELLAAVVQRKTGGSFNGTFRVFADEDNTPLQFPVSANKLGAAWTNNSNGSPTFAINYGGTYHQIRGLWPMLGVTNTLFNDTSTPDVIGNVWIPRFKCRVTGLWAWVDADRPSVWKFYDTDGVTVLAACRNAQNEKATINAGLMFLPFDSLLGATTVTPTVGGTYRIGIEPTSSLSMTVYEFSVNAVALMDCFGLGQNYYKTSAKDPTGTGSWTNVTTSRTLMGVTIDQLDDGAPSGGGIISRSLIAGGA